VLLLLDTAKIAKDNESAMKDEIITGISP